MLDLGCYGFSLVQIGFTADHLWPNDVGVPEFDDNE